MRMAEYGDWATGDTVAYMTNSGERITGKVTKVLTRRAYWVIPEGTLGIVDTVDER